MKIFVCLSFCFLFLESCQNEQKPIQNTAKLVDSTQYVPQNIYDRATFVVTHSTDSTETPRSIVSFAFGKMVEKLDTTSGDFQFLESSEMKEMKMPKSYILTGRAFWAGLQTIIVIDSTAKGYVIKKQYQDEGSKGGEPFEVVKTFPK